MAYSEVIKNFNRIRDYLREFYVYGFKGREEYTGRSSRSYDNERRRLESWLGDAVQFRQTSEGRNVFISIDSRVFRHNPLYKAWKTKSFTDGDITLHFLLMDILASSGRNLSINEIMEKIDKYLSVFPEPRMFDESTVRKKLKEYVSVGIVEAEKHGKALYYKCAVNVDSYNSDILDFFSETAPCGVIGSFLLDKQMQQEGIFAFKHHYITGTMDSELLYQLFIAIQEKREAAISTINRHRKGRISENRVIPLKIMFSAQNGRQYLMAYNVGARRVKSFRLDNLVSVKIGEVCPEYEELRKTLEHMLPHIWGVSTQSRSGQRMEHVEFTVHYGDEEQYIHQRMEREKRCGTVEKLDAHTSRFQADVYDASEIIPWIRTFICRITEIHFSDLKLEAQFKDDLKEMYRLYGIGDDLENA